MRSGEEIESGDSRVLEKESIEDFAIVKQKIMMVTKDRYAKYFYEKGGWEKLELMDNESVTHLKSYKGIYVLASFANGSIVETRLHLFDVGRLAIKKSIWGDPNIDKLGIVKHKMERRENHFRDLQFLPSNKSPFRNYSCHLLIGMYRWHFSRVFMVSEKDIINTGIVFDLGRSNGYFFSLSLLPKQLSFLVYMKLGPIIKCTINIKSS